MFTWAGNDGRRAAPRRTDGADESIGSFMRRRFGDEATTYLAEPLLAGIHAGDVDRLSIHACFPRLVETERTHGSLLAAFRRDRPAQRVARRRVQVAPGRPQRDGARAGRAAAGGLRKTRTPSGVSSSIPPRVETAAAEPIAGRAVIVAAPAYVAADRDLDEDLARLAPAPPSLCVYSHRRARVPAIRGRSSAERIRDSWCRVPERTGILAASWLSSKWPHRAPEDRVLMRAFVGGARDPEALGHCRTAELVSVALSACVRCSGSTGVLARVYRSSAPAPSTRSNTWRASKPSTGR